MSGQTKKSDKPAKRKGGARDCENGTQVQVLAIQLRAGLTRLRLKHRATGRIGKSEIERQFGPGFRIETIKATGGQARGPSMSRTKMRQNQRVSFSRGLLVQWT